MREKTMVYRVGYLATFMSLFLVFSFFSMTLVSQATLEGNINDFRTYSSGHYVKYTVTSTISGYSNGTSTETFGYQDNVNASPHGYIAQNFLLVNFPGLNGYSEFDVELWSPPSACSSTNPYDYHFTMGYGVVRDISSQAAIT